DHFVAARFPDLVCLLQQIPVDKRAFPDGTCHGLPALLEVPRADDELVRRLVGAGALALGRLAPRSNRMTATRGAAFTTTMRVVDRVHRDTANVRTLAQPAIAAGLADRGVRVIRIGHRTHGRQARAVHEALLARVEAKDRPTGVAAHILSVGTGRAGH